MGMELISFRARPCEGTSLLAFLGMYASMHSRRDASSSRTTPDAGCRILYP